MIQTIDKKLGKPMITLELIEQVGNNLLIVENYDNFTKYVLAKCLTKEFVNDSELSDYIDSLKQTKSYKYFKEKRDLK